MGRKSLFDHDALAVVLMSQNGVITRGQARDCGMSRHGLEHRVRVGGPWQPLLPGVYMTSTGSPTGLERLQAALLYAGPGSAITGPAALALHHIGARQIIVVDVLIPEERKRRSLEFVRVHRTSRMPSSLIRMGEVSYVAPVAWRLGRHAGPRRAHERSRYCRPALLAQAAAHRVAAVASEIRSALEAGHQRGRPGIRAVA